jgi:hypothetical protein
MRNAKFGAQKKVGSRRAHVRDPVGREADLGHEPEVGDRLVQLRVEHRRERRPDARDGARRGTGPGAGRQGHDL